MNRFRKAVTTGVLGATFAVTGLVAAAPAQAATGTSFCFRWNSGGAAYANYPVHLWRVDAYGRQISHLRQGKTGSNGCATFYRTPSNVHLRVYVHFTSGWQTFYGATPYIANPGSGTVFLGTGWVY